MKRTFCAENKVQLINAEQRRVDSVVKKRLIGEVQKRPALWDRRLDEHRIKSTLEGLWEEIAVVMGDVVDSKETCKKLWKNLQAHFRNIYIQTIGSGTGFNDTEEAIKAVKWGHFKQMMFLRDTILRINYWAISNMQRSENPEVDKNESVGGSDILDDMPQSTVDDSASTEKELYSEQSSIFRSLDSSQATRIRDAHSGITEPLYEQLTILNRKLDLTNGNDDVGHFTNYLAVVMRRVPAALRTQCESAILQVANNFADGTIPFIVVPQGDGSQN